MRRVIALALLLTLILAGALSAQEEPQLVPPPAINVPYGANLVMEINISDRDILGIVKQVIPEVANAAKDLARQMSVSHEQSGGCPVPGAYLNIATAIDVEQLMEALDGVTNLRWVAYKYSRPLNTNQLIGQLDKGVAKSGEFSRILVFTEREVVVAYADYENGGYLGYLYNPKDNTLMAARMVGNIDIPKLTRWLVNIGKFFFVTRVEVEPEMEPGTYEEEEIPEDFDINEPEENELIE